MGLQFNLWSAFREWGETTDEEWTEETDDLDDTAKLRKAVNLAKMYGSLVAENILSLQILKVRFPVQRENFGLVNERCWVSLIFNPSQKRFWRFFLLSLYCILRTIYLLHGTLRRCFCVLIS
jgi:hypothetical protein